MKRLGQELVTGEVRIGQRGVRGTGTPQPRLRKPPTPGCSSSRPLPDSGAGMSDGALGAPGSCAWSLDVMFWVPLLHLQWR